MNEVKFDELSAVAYRFKDAADSARDELRKLHENIASSMQNTVRSNIAGMGIKDTHGKVSGWQEKYVGSYGGYAAVRPRKSTSAEKANKSASSPGAITNYLENGTIRYTGFYFYRLSKRMEYKKAKRAAEKLRDRIVSRLSGGD